MKKQEQAQPTLVALNEYLVSLPATGTRNVTDALLPIAEFAKVSAHTVTRWRGKQGHPLGEGLTRVMFFLESKGYRIAELERLSPEVYELAKLVGFGAISITDGLSVTRYTKLQSLWFLLHGKGGILPSKRSAIAAMCETRREDFQKRFGIPLARQGQVQSREVFPVRHEISVPQAPREGAGREERLAMLAQLAALINAARPFARRIASDEFSDAERATLHQFAGNGAIFDFSNALNELCSPDARVALRRKKGGIR